MASPLMAGITFDGIKLLGIVNPKEGAFTCVGRFSCGDERCTVHIPELKQLAALHIIGSLPSATQDSAVLQAQLNELARLLLCVTLHQDQAYEIVERWSGLISAEIELYRRRMILTRVFCSLAGDLDHGAVEVKQPAGTDRRPQSGGRQTTQTSTPVRNTPVHALVAQNATRRPRKLPNTRPAATRSVPAAVPSTPARVPSTPVRAPSAPIRAPSTLVRAPSTPLRAPSTPVRDPFTPAKTPSTPVRAQRTHGVLLGAAQTPTPVRNTRSISQRTAPMPVRTAMLLTNNPRIAPWAVPSVATADQHMPVPVSAPARITPRTVQTAPETAQISTRSQGVPVSVPTVRGTGSSIRLARGPVPVSFPHGHGRASSTHLAGETMPVPVLAGHGTALSMPQVVETMPVRSLIGHETVLGIPQTGGHVPVMTLNAPVKNLTLQTAFLGVRLDEEEEQQHQRPSQVAQNVERPARRPRKLEIRSTQPPPLQDQTSQDQIPEDLRGGVEISDSSSSATSPTTPQDQRLDAENKGSSSSPPVSPLTITPQANQSCCTICLDPPLHPCHTPCGHIFCHACITTWLEDKDTLQKTCPLDRRALMVEDLVLGRPAVVS